MLKKSLLLVVALMVIGLAVVPQVQAQNFDEATAREMEQLAADFEAGRITLPEFQRRILEIQSRVSGQNQGALDAARQAQQQQPQILQQQQQAMQQAQRDQQQMQQAQQYPGETRGWPTASIFSQCNLPNLPQPAGTTVSYTYNSQTRNLRLYIMNGTQNNANEITRAIQADGKATSSNISNEYSYFALPAPSGLRLGRNGHYQVTIEFRDGQVELWVREVAG